MIYDSREFLNGAKRRAQLLREGSIMHMGKVGTGSGALGDYTDDIFSIVKNALPIINGQRVFNAQMKGQSVPVQYTMPPEPRAAPSNFGRIALLGGLGVLGIVLFKTVLSRR